MATMGFEYIEHFSNARARGYVTAQDLTSAYYIAEFMAWRLEAAGHLVRFRLREHSVHERNMRESTRPVQPPAERGNDLFTADRVDLFLIATHGAYTERTVHLLYDVERSSWEGHSRDWSFGDNCDMEWLMIYGCHTIDSDDIVAHHHMFKGMHLFCGAYGDMFDSFTLSEAGGDIADLLLCGTPVSEAWTDGASDWFCENHPMVISVERQETWRNGNPDWSNTTMKSDHLWGEGITRADILPNAQHWMAKVWSDRGIYD